MNTVNEWADFWRFQIGVNVIPADTKNKTTWIKWSDYQDKPISLEMHEHWKRNDRFKDGMAIILGKVWHNTAKEGLFLNFIDLDNKKAIEEFCTRDGVTTPLKELGKRMIVEQHKDDLERAHIYCYSTHSFAKKSSDLVKSADSPAIEVKGLGTHGIAYCTPSPHKNGSNYEIINTLEPEILDVLEGHIDSICKKHGIPYLGNDNGNNSQIPMDELHKPETIIYEGQNRHLQLLRKMESLIQINRHEDLQDIKPLANKWNEKHCEPPLSDADFEKQWKCAVRFIEKKKKNENEGQKDSFEVKESVGKTSFNKDKEEEDKPPKRYLQKFSNGELLAESIVIGGFPFFLVARNGKVTVKDQIPFPDLILKPLEPTAYVNKPYCFNSTKEIEVYLNNPTTLDSLYRKVKSIWKKYIDADDFHISICAADTIFTYFQDKIGLTHYLFFVGNNASGKSNNLRIFQQLAYRNMTSTDITAANIYQFLGSEQEGIGTICEDEADNIDEDRDKMRIYKNGYTTGYPILRTDTNYGRKQYRFFTFGFKAYAAERLPDSLKAKGFNQRIIELYCVYGVPPYDISEVINPAGEQEFQTLVNELEETRNELLIYRLLHYHDSLPDIKLFLQNREKQLFKPLLRVFQNTETLKELLPVISNYVGKKRQSNANSYHAFLYRSIIELIKSKGEVIFDSSEIITKIKDDLGGEYVIGQPQTFISQEFGAQSHKRIIQTLKDIFGATKSKSHNESRKLIFDKTKLEKLGQIYELDIDVNDILIDRTHRTHRTHPGVIRGVTDYFVNGGNGDSKAENNDNPIINEKITEELQSQPSTKTVIQPNNASEASEASEASPVEKTKVTCPTCHYTAEPYWIKLHQCERTGKTI